MPFRTVARDASAVVGIATRTSADPRAEIGRLWQRFFAEDVAARVPNRVDGTVYSLYTEYEGDHTRPYTVVLGYAVSELGPLPEGLEARTIPAGTYAVLEGVAADPAAIGAAWQSVYAAAVPRRFTTDFDVHHVDGPRAGTVDLYVAVAAAGA